MAATAKRKKAVHQVAPEHRGFQCPKCGSWYWGTSNCTSAFEEWIGHCHGCRFTWRRAVDDAKVMTRVEVE